MAQYIPDRNDILWLDFDPTKGKEIGKYIKLLSMDVKEDFLKFHKEDFIQLTDEEKKNIMSSAGQNTLPLLQQALS